ncbi:MAG: hypothetical protein ACJ0HZ_06545 [Woeseiaceae bacterium]
MESKERLTWEERNAAQYDKHNLKLKISDGEFIAQLRKYAKNLSYATQINFEDLVNDVLIKFMQEQKKLQNHPEIIGWSKVTCKNRFYDLLKKHSHIKESNNANIDEPDEVDKNPIFAISSIFQFKKKDSFSTRVNNQIQAEKVKLSNTSAGRFEVLGLNDAIKRAHEQDCDLLQLTRGEKIPICRLQKKFSSISQDYKIATEIDQSKEKDNENNDLCNQVLKFIETDEFNDKERLVLRYKILGSPNPKEIGITAANARVIYHRAMKKINKWRQALETEI